MNTAVDPRVIAQDKSYVSSIETTQFKLDKLRWEQTLDESGPRHSFAHYAAAVGMSAETISVSARAIALHNHKPGDPNPSPAAHTIMRTRAANSAARTTVIEELATATGKSSHTVSKWKNDQIDRARQRAQDLAAEQGGAPTTEHYKAAARAVAAEDNADTALRASIKVKLRAVSMGRIVTDRDVERVLRDAQNYTDAHQVSLETAIARVVSRFKDEVSAQNKLDEAERTEARLYTLVVRSGEAAMSDLHEWSTHLGTLLGETELSERGTTMLNSMVARATAHLTVIQSQINGTPISYEAALHGLESTHVSDEDLRRFLEENSADKR